jgi:hypothetical protein
MIVNLPPIFPCDFPPVAPLPQPAAPGNFPSLDSILWGCQVKPRHAPGNLGEVRPGDILLGSQDYDTADPAGAPDSRRA